MSNQEHLLKVLLAPHISEKATVIGEKNKQFVFRVIPEANKPDIKAAVELLFKTQVKSVRIVNVKTKPKRRGNTIGRSKAWKKAYVALKEGQDINFAGAEKP